MEHFSRLYIADASTVQHLEEPVQPIKELGALLNSIQYKMCNQITVSRKRLRKYYKKEHQQAQKGDTRALYKDIKVQSFFRTRGLQKYFIINLDVVENREKLDPNYIIQQQLDHYKKVRQQL